MRPLRTLVDEGKTVVILDQTKLPHETAFVVLRTLTEAAHAIRVMQVRGAPLIGATAAYGVALGLTGGAAAATALPLETILATLSATRPTAVNLHWALDRMKRVLSLLPLDQQEKAAWLEAHAIAREDEAANEAIGHHGLPLLQALHTSLAHRGRGAGREGVNIMTHCNAGWLATVAHGTAISPIYAAHAAGIPLHVWVSETRPRNQGHLTAWELDQAGIPHTLMADNAAGLLMMQGKVDCVIVGADRIAANGDTANKIGTYLKALAAHAHGIPFYVAAPMSTIDFACPDGTHIPIEERAKEELDARVHVRVANPAFDVTPASLITGIITERGVTASGELRCKVV
ncbi:MAG: S-methyl-5-thioribose-1-phosphate isomerase [Rhodocyclaceae bacterium]|nr:S-methyl-5-thioribose-1-phosphate isomerase [Rhodocyclaceae bacterium]